MPYARSATDGTFGDGSPTSDIDAHQVGSGYVWLHLTDGVDIAIDDHRVHRIE